MTVLNRQSLATHFRAMTSIERREIFDSADVEYRPINLPADSATMFAGYVGPLYKSGSCLFLAINPGGGGDAYVERTIEDERFYPLLHYFKASSADGVLAAFEAINDAFQSIVQRWNLWRILGPTCEATSRSIAQVAYLNVVPYRTRSDRLPPVAAQRVAWARIVAPTIRLLEPQVLIALGRKADKIIARMLSGSHTGAYYCVPRTIGDSYVSAEADKVLRRIREEYARS